MILYKHDIQQSFNKNFLGMRERSSSLGGYEEPKSAKLADTSLEPEYTEISTHTSKIKKFSIEQHVTTFAVSERTQRPEENLRRIFGKLINKGYRNANMSGKHVEKFGVMIFADKLKEPITIPPRDRLQNSPEAIVNE